MNNLFDLVWVHISLACNVFMLDCIVHVCTAGIHPAVLPHWYGDVPEPEYIGPSLWPLEAGKLRRKMIRAENDASKKAGVIVMDYNKLKLCTNGFSSRPKAKGGSLLGRGAHSNAFFLQITRYEQTSQVACKRIHKVYALPCEEVYWCQFPGIIHSTVASVYLSLARSAWISEMT